MTIPTFYDYKGYCLAVDVTAYGAPTGTVRVLDKASHDLTFTTTSLDKAMRWVDAYRDGVQWAVSEKLAQEG